MHKKKKECILNNFLLAILLVLIAICIFIFINKQTEKSRIESLIAFFRKRIHEIEATIEQQEKKFKRAYFSMKIIIGLILFSILFITGFYSDKHDFFTILDNCLSVMGGLSFLLLVACFFFEEDPLSIFHMRSRLKKYLQDYYFKPIQPLVNSLELYKTEEENAKKDLSNIEEEINKMMNPNS